MGSGREYKTNDKNGKKYKNQAGFYALSTKHGNKPQFFLFIIF